MSLIEDRIGPKYRIGEHSFTIEHMRRHDGNGMPQPHAHPFYELYYLLEGERVYSMNGQILSARKGDFILINPHDVHTTSKGSIPGFERILIGFSPAFATGMELGICGLLPFNCSRLLRLPEAEQPEMERILWQMLQECKERRPHYEIAVRSLLAQLLIRIHRVEENIRQSCPVPLHPMQDKISEIVTYVNNNYTEPLTLEGAANRFYISPSYLSRMFSRFTGFRFSEYLRVVRVREAQRRLLSTQERVQMIAEKVGFEHTAHFNKTFKQVTGTTPLRYRKEHR
ncbi:AraC family transcriptional regulator [Paenibacillus sp. ClWae2A]|uniref:helix-turn-helix transcriptional regulator n=1 Tax=Paenibacillus sp. ClWae2A TaxID=3057177 RepID=UPI0028F62C68|nr:AraC family transcriptional regulator [Paenibacillus sp. ClWae2A]MDT9722565.1 AraC family transcriptional regulator [Paenibacillus sp. ClWae2A]